MTRYFLLALGVAGCLWWLRSLTRRVDQDRMSPHWLIESERRLWGARSHGADLPTMRHWPINKVRNADAWRNTRDLKRTRA